MTNPIRIVWNNTIGRLKYQYEKELNRIVGDTCTSLLDVGCGFNSPVQHLHDRPRRMVGVDGFSAAIQKSRAKNIHDEYHGAHLLEIERIFGPRSFDTVLASDVIEHFTKKDGLELLKQLETIARNKIIVCTPNGFLPQGKEYGNPMQAHLSGWTPEEMKSLGYSVIGIQGIKHLRGEMAAIKWRPRCLWHSLSLLSQWITRDHPSIAFRILCIKHKE